MKQSTYMWEASFIVRSINPFLEELSEPHKKIALDWINFQSFYTDATNGLNRYWRDLPQLRDYLLRLWRFSLLQRSVFNMFFLHSLSFEMGRSSKHVFEAISDFNSSEKEVIDFLRSNMDYFIQLDRFVIAECPSIEFFPLYGVMFSDIVGEEEIYRAIVYCRQNHVDFNFGSGKLVVDYSALKEIPNSPLINSLSFVVDADFLSRLDSLAHEIYNKSREFIEKLAVMLGEQSSKVFHFEDVLNVEIKRHFVDYLSSGDLETEDLLSSGYEFLGQDDGVSSKVVGNKVRNVFLQIGKLNPRFIFLNTVDCVMEKLYQAQSRNSNTQQKERT